MGYYITDRHAIGGSSALLENVKRLGARADIIQVRERDMDARALAALTREVLQAVDPHVRVLVNDRADVAFACGAHGVHLRGSAVPASVVRQGFPEPFLISVACHSVEEARVAAVEGADLILLSPIYATPGKEPALGLRELARAARLCTKPVLALGGVREENAAECVRAGAAGIAGITFFQNAAALSGADGETSSRSRP